MACESQTSQTNYLHIFAAMLLNEHICLNILSYFPFLSLFRPPPLPHVVMQVEVFHLKQRLQSMENRAPTPRKPFNVQCGEWRTNLNDQGHPSTVSNRLSYGRYPWWESLDKTQNYLACKTTSIVQLEAIIYIFKLSIREFQ